MLLRNILKKIDLKVGSFLTFRQKHDQIHLNKLSNEISKFAPYRREPMETNLSKSPIIMTADEAMSQIKSSNLYKIC